MSLDTVKDFIEKRICYLEKEKVLVASGIELIRVLEGTYELERVLAHINEFIKPEVKKEVHGGPQYREVL